MGAHTLKAANKEMQYVIDQTGTAVTQLGESFQGIIGAIQKSTEESQALIAHFAAGRNGGRYSFDSMEELIRRNREQDELVTRVIDNIMGDDREPDRARSGRWPRKWPGSKTSRRKWGTSPTRRTSSP